TEFLEQGTVVFNGIRSLIDQQFNRLSALETQIMEWIAVNRQPVSFLKLQDEFLQIASKTEILEALESLLRRSLVEKGTEGFAQQPVVTEYCLEQVAQQI
ncbi:MAG TPA: hypothetical protein V6C65_36690, partial [Allocoleopsis sp.]